MKHRKRVQCVENIVTDFNSNEDEPVKPEVVLDSIIMKSSKYFSRPSRRHLGLMHFDVQ